MAHLPFKIQLAVVHGIGVTTRAGRIIVVPRVPWGLASEELGVQVAHGETPAAHDRRDELDGLRVCRQAAQTFCGKAQADHRARAACFTIVCRKLGHVCQQPINMIGCEKGRKDEEAVGFKALQRGVGERSVGVRVAADGGGGAGSGRGG